MKHGLSFGRIAFALLICATALVGITPETASAATYNVTDYGAVPNDAGDDTDAFRAALLAARNAGGAHIIRVPAGTFMVRATSPGPYNSIRIWPNLRLSGAGPKKTTLKMIASTVSPSWRAIRVIVLDSNASVNGLTVDGSRSEINRTQIRNAAAQLIAVSANSSGQTIENIRTRNSYSQDIEGFSIAITQGRNVRVRNIEAFNNDGTGMTIGGEIYPSFGNMSENVTVQNAIFHHNRYQGITFYGAKSVVISNVTAYSNEKNGINIEWSRNITVRDSLAYDNAWRGFNTFGVSYGIWVETLTTRNNGANYLYAAEVGILPGYWGLNSGIANPETGIVERGLTQDIAFINCSFSPPAGKPHVYVEPDPATTTLGTVFPTVMLLYGNGIDSWNFQVNHIDGISRSGLPAYVKTNFGIDVIIE